MCLAAALWLLAAASPSPATSPPALDPERMLRLLKKTPQFGAPSRALQKIIRSMAVPGSEGKGYFVEFQWLEKEATHTGIAGIGQTSLTPDKWLAVEDGWGVTNLIEDKTWDDLIQGLRDARVASDEASARGDVLTVISAEAAFQTVAEGYYGEPTCLTQPASCLPGYTGPTFLDTTFPVFGDRRHYRRTFHPGKRHQGKAGTSGLVETFAVTAAPLSPGEGRAYCGDQRGRICVTEDGSLPPVAGGTCADPCKEWH